MAHSAQLKLSAVGLTALVAAACASTAPFSTGSPGLDMMGQEEAHFFGDGSVAREALGANPLRARIDNTVMVYETELARARAAQGGFLNSVLSILGLALPISGTAASVALSDPDDIETVSIVTGVATTAVLALNLLVKPGEASASAARCEAFLESALALYERRWGPDRVVSGTAEEWDTYLTMRATLEPGRIEACAN